MHEHINRKHLDIRGCWGSEVRHFLAALSALARHGQRVPWQRIGSAPYALADINDALSAAAAMTVTKALVNPWKD